MDDDTTFAYCALMQLLSLRLQKLEHEMQQLLKLYELEESNCKYYQSMLEFLLEVNINESSARNRDTDNDGKLSLQQNSSDYGLPVTNHKDKETKKNVYIPKYQWTDKRTQRLLDSVERHYSELLKSKDYCKPVWEMIRTEVDVSDPHLKWHTCRNKWSHLLSDYNNYIKDLQEYTGRNTAPELTVYVPHYYEQIGTILRSDDTFSHNQGCTEAIQKLLEEKIGKVQKTNASWAELGKQNEEDLITVTEIEVSVPQGSANNNDSSQDPVDFN